MKIQGKGTVLQFTPADGETVAVGRLTKVGEIAPQAEELDVTTLDSQGGYREYMQGMRSAGTLEISGFLDQENAGQAAIRAAFDSGDAGAFQVIFADGSQAQFSAFVKQYAIGSAEVNGAIGFSAALRITGAVSFA